MPQGFWGKLEKPFFVLAPMANVTDTAFRRMIAKYSPGGRHVTFTEFVSADGLALAHDAGRAKLMRDLVFCDEERPIVAQFFTARPDLMERAARLAAELGFDGVDINMGCPDRAIERQGAGAALIKTPALALEIVASAKRGAVRKLASGEEEKLPVSVKTRLGYNRDELDRWLPELLGAAPAAITIHARTRKEMSSVPARWERIRRAVELRDRSGSATLIVGNGDVRDLSHGRALAAQSGADGVMIGRGVFGAPWSFSYSRELENNTPERLRISLEHTELFETLLGDCKHFALMKKHYRAYVEGFDGAKELRAELMETTVSRDVAQIIGRFLKGHAPSLR